MKTQAKAGILIEAMPYLQSFSGKTLVIKVGGELVENSEKCHSFVQDLLLLKSVGIKVVLCHGGGPQISQAMKGFGKEPVFVDGHRATDAETLKITSMVLLGQINSTLVSMFNAKAPQAIGLSGIDGQLLKVKKKDSRLGFVGLIEQVNPEAVTRVLDDGYLPVIASLGIDNSGQIYNINADAAAGALAGALNAAKLIVLTNVEGLYETFGDESSLISRIILPELQTLREKKELSPSIYPKLEAAITAIENDVPQVHILDGRMTHAVLLEIFTSEGIGTMITKNTWEDSYENK